jgi:hypothetical protein
MIKFHIWSSKERFILSGDSKIEHNPLQIRPVNNLLWQEHHEKKGSASIATN